MKRLSLFVYGTLKPGGENYPFYLTGRTIREQDATVAGAVLYTEGLYPYLVIDPALAEPADRVHGVLITMHPERYEATLSMVDRLETYQPGRASNVYDRVPYPVQVNGDVVTAWVYIAAPRTMTAIRTGLLHRVSGTTWHPGLRSIPGKRRGYSTHR